MTHRLALVALLGTATLFTIGCDSPGLASKAKTANDVAKTSDAGGSATSGRAGASKGATAGSKSSPVVTPGLHVSDAIARACGFESRATSGAAAPNFDFDSAALGEADREMLGDVARCLTEGALRGKSVALVGRADARGEPEYNMILGGSRADAVHRYLVDLGVGRERMRATSRGELDATGMDESGWAHDRRVDIELML